SAEALAALVRRPPPGRLLLAIAGRAGQLPESLAGAVADAARTGTATTFELAPLSRAEAAELLGGEAAAAVYTAAGGNPFYLEELARAVTAPGGRTPRRA